MKNENLIFIFVMLNFIYKELEKLDQCVIKYKFLDFIRYVRLFFG